VLSIAGWGRTGTRKGSPFLQTSATKISNQKCLEAYGQIFIQRLMICAGERSKNICDGDSGGPIFQFLNRRAAIYGVASWGGLSCRRSPGVFSKIDRNWILKVSKNMARRSPKASR
jgi:secreted trypsin-like serine protease